MVKHSKRIKNNSHTPDLVLAFPYIKVILIWITKSAKWGAQLVPMAMPIGCLNTRPLNFKNISSIKTSMILIKSVSETFVWISIHPSERQFFFLFNILFLWNKSGQITSICLLDWNGEYLCKVYKSQMHWYFCKIEYS